MVRIAATAMSPIRAKLLETKREIAALKVKIDEQNQSISEFEEAIILLSSNAKYTPKNGEVLPFDQLKKLLNEQENESDKQAKLTTAHESLQICKLHQKSNFADLANSNTYLIYLQGEEEWENNYAPFADKYKAAFPLKSALQKRQKDIDDLVRDISNKKQILAEAQKWVDAPSNSKPRYSVTPPYDKPIEVVKRIPAVISALEVKLRVFGETPIVESPAYQQKFRQFVKARVSIDDSLTAFLDIQSSYQIALERLQLDLEDISPETLNLNVNDLILRKTLVVDGDNVIRYV